MSACYLRHEDVLKIVQCSGQRPNRVDGEDPDGFDAPVCNLEVTQDEVQLLEKNHERRNGEGADDDERYRVKERLFYKIKTVKY